MISDLCFEIAFLLSSYKNIDLRSEKEFHKGTIPGSVNIPILSNDEFENVGKEYKNKGQEAAINLGLQLVKGDLKNKRIDAWKHHLNNNQNEIGNLHFRYHTRMDHHQKSN